MKEVGTYILHNPETDETYVGSGILRKRENRHFNTLKAGTHHNHRLQAAYGRNPSFDFVSVPMQNFEEARKFEQALIDENWGNPLFLNLSKSVDECRPLPDAVVRQKLSEAVRQRLAEGWRPAMLGRQHSEETKALYSEQRKGNQHALGSKHTEEWKQSRSQAMLGNQQLRGHVHSEETRAKMSAARRGVPKSPEAILKAATGRTQNNVVVDGVKYLNAAEAAKDLGLSRSGVDKRCASEKFPNYYKIQKEQ